MAAFGTQILQHLVDSRNIYKALRIPDYSDKFYRITAVNEVVYNPKLKLHNEIQFSSPQGTMMVNCEMSFLDGNGKIHLYDYLFAVPSSGEPSNFNTYTVEYDAVLQIHRVCKKRRHAVDSKDELWSECVRSRQSRQAVASTEITFPFLSWPFPAPVPRRPKLSTRDGEGPSSSSSEKTGADTPITPLSPQPEGLSPTADMGNAKLLDTTPPDDLAVTLIEPQEFSSTVEDPTPERYQQAHALEDDRDVERLLKQKEVVSVMKQNQSEEELLKCLEIKRKCVAVNVTVRARDRGFGVHACQALLVGLPGSSPLRTCLSLSETTEDIQQTVASAILPEKMPPRYPAHPFDVIVREGNAECKAYQAKPHTPGYLSQYLRAGTEAEINNVWLASPLSSKNQLSFTEADDLALALWRWHQMCSKTKELRISGGFVPSRLDGREGDNAERSAWSEGIRKENPKETSLDRVPFTEHSKMNGNGNGQVEMPHHFNLDRKPVYCKTYTPPEVSLWASYQPDKNFREHLREHVLVSQARELLDQYYYYGPPEHLNERGTKLRETVIGLVAKVYDLAGTWIYDDYDPDETIPISWEEVARRYGWVDPRCQMPKNNQTLDPQDDETVQKESNDFYRPESNVSDSQRRLEALDLAGNRQWPKYEDLATSSTRAPAPTLDTGERFTAVTSKENQTLAEVVNERSRPEPDVSEQPASHSSGKMAVDEVLDGHSSPPSNVSEQSMSESSEGSVATGEIQDEQSGPERQTTGSESFEEDEVTGEVLDEQSGSECQATGFVTSEEEDVTHETQDEQSGPERQMTASDAASECRDRSYSDFLDESFTEEDIIQSTPPSQGASSVLSNADNSPTRQRKLPFNNERANALVRSLAREDSEEEVQAHLNRVRLDSPPTDRPHVHNSEDEDSIDYTDTWARRNQLPTAPNPKLAKFAETSVEEEEDLDSSNLDQAIKDQAPEQAVQGGFTFGPQNSASPGRVQPQTTSSSTSPNTCHLSVLAPEESDERDLDDDFQNDEAESDPAWLEHMAERDPVDGDDDLPAPAGQEIGRAVDNSPMEDGADPSWLDYQEARGVMDAVFDEAIQADEAERAADEAAKRRETQNEDNMLRWLQETADIETSEQGDVQRQRQTRAATIAALAQYSDISEIPLPSTPTFSEYFFGSWALSLGAMVAELPFACS